MSCIICVIVKSHKKLKVKMRHLWGGEGRDRSNYKTASSHPKVRQAVAQMRCATATPSQGCSENPGLGMGPAAAVSSGRSLERHSVPPETSPAPRGKLQDHGSLEHEPVSYALTQLVHSSGSQRHIRTHTHIPPRGHRQNNGLGHQLKN